jgi:hypothetical protein
MELLSSELGYSSVHVTGFLRYCARFTHTILFTFFNSIGQTHSLDPAVQLPDGSHMDVARGFKPERWLDEATKPTEYMPFGYGPRYVTC